ncbi:LemA family protein [Diaphorobacter aerolatus]|uniref:LemA family protein n=1 Tax=Diaphorobacter aerolatus TaxID=1288495 RepID=A0A7H0GH41_9BURK|nr:LemA family protein [Diaphorobacter aerolatus]QNP47607.1 LemA family protein [Diaphorobacter aerolatus]
MYLTGWLIALAVLVFWAVGAYNRLVRLRSSAIQAFGALDAELLRRTALLGEYDAAVSGPRMLQDAQMYDALRASGTQFAASLAVMRSRPLDASAGAALVAGRKVLDAAWQALADASTQAAKEGDEGESGGNAVLNSLVERSVYQGTQIDFAIAQYNTAVAHYNKAVTQFPANLLAWVFGFKQALML